MDFCAYHNSHDIFYRCPFGAVACGQKIVFRIQISALSIETCYLRLLEGDKEKILSMHKVNVCNSERKNVFEIEYLAPADPGLVWYYFILPVGSTNYFYGNNPARLGGEGQLWEQEPPAYQLTVHLPMQIPKWYQEGVMYQIYVDRFYNGSENQSILNARKRSLIHSDWYDTPFYIKDGQGRVVRWNFFGGNLKGVLKKLPYLKELGISIIYFNPIFDSPSNHKYDTADYKKIDPMYGDESTFELLIREAKQQGIAIILDGVFSHTGSDSIYFNKYGNYPSQGAYDSPDSPYYNWFKFKENREYECWWGVDDLPEVDEMESSYRHYIYGGEDSVIHKWMEKGVRGWRLDVADELPDEFIQELRQAMKKIDPESVLIGEVWEDASNKVSYSKLRKYLWGNELDSTMNYPIREIFVQFLLGQTDAQLVHQKVMSLYENYPRENFLATMNLIGSHDQVRILTLLGDAPSAEILSERERETYCLTPPARELAIRRLKLLVLVQMGFPGVPCVYYGDEAGLEGYADPYNRRTYPWGREDKEILDWYKRAIRLRREYNVLHSGNFLSFCANADLYGFKRIGDKEEVIVLINRHPQQEKEICLSFDTESMTQVLDLISAHTLGQGEVRSLTLKLDPLEGKVLFCQKSNSTYRKEGLTRACGVLLHVTSLPSPWGIGDLGLEAYKFLDFLAECRQSLWQVLPLNPVGLGDSPYQSDSAFAGNLMLISIDHLITEGLIEREEAQQKFIYYMTLPKESATFAQVGKFKRDLLFHAFKRFQLTISQQKDNEFKNEGKSYLCLKNYHDFKDENREWLEDFALFRVLKSLHQGRAWCDWEKDIASRDRSKMSDYAVELAEEIEFHYYIQYTFYYQWHEIKKYANAKGIKIIGDIPIFVAGDSCDTWSNREFFKLDERGRPLKVAGVPPDYFSKTGQLWGNPVYDWDALALADYSWWKMRIKQAFNLYDYLRLDHFRGFEGYWEICAGEKTAEKGRWMKGPGKRFFESLAKEFGELPFIAEDLGVITSQVNILKTIFGFPGMKVLQFTKPEDIDRQNDHNFVYYTGTHDNDTLLGWYTDQLSQEQPSWEGELWREQFQLELTQEKLQKDQLMNKKFKDEQLMNKEDRTIKRACRKLIEKLYKSNAAWVIVPLQDILGLDSKARMNTPGTIEGNWKWRLEKDSLSTEIKEWLRTLARNSGRDVLRCKE